MNRVVGALFLSALVACSGGESNHKKNLENELIHSFSNPSEAVVRHLSWQAKVDFETQKLLATANYTIETADDADRIVLDAKNLEIKAVLVDGMPTKSWWLGPDHSVLGNALEIEITPETKSITIKYETTDGAEAVQWLSPQQTAGKKHPFLFTQSQAILARTWIPCQDSPAVRFTYDAAVEVPQGLMAVMSASNPQSVDSTGHYKFHMEQPIPSYLMALAVGDMVFQKIGDETGVYAEPSVIEAAAYEFEDMQKMLEVTESLYGDYRWERYDVLVLPPSFPFGGMENPRLTFATPTILAGDKSLTALIAHELAHSWSGNLVTNKTWNDFWLNEGFTVYVERRIMEALYGKEYTEMLALLGRQDLEKTLEHLSDMPEDTRLKISLEERNPDDGMTDVAYEKGYFFLRTLEASVGRERFDAFLNSHFNRHAFKSISTEDFLSALKSDLLGGSEEQYKALEIEKWVYEPGLPNNCVKIESNKFAQVDAQREAWLGGTPIEAVDTANWSTHQWLHFLRNMPGELSQEQLQTLDKAYAFTETGNSEIAAEWYVLAIENGYTEADPAIEAFLIRVGRRKFLSPIYEALVDADPSMKKAREIYTQARPNYHAVSIQTLDKLLKI